MIFDFTKGEKPNWMVLIVQGNNEDKVYYHYYREAKKCFDDEVASERTLTVCLFDERRGVLKDKAKTLGLKRRV